MEANEVKREKDLAVLFNTIDIGTHAHYGIYAAARPPRRADRARSHVQRGGDCDEEEAMKNDYTG